MAVCDQAFVTFAGGDVSCQGALVLGQSLRNHRTSRRLVVLTDPRVSERIRTVLARVFDEVLQVDLVGGADYARRALARRPELGVALSKLHCWTLTQYSKCVFLDADTLVLANIDDLFERPELSAAPDPGWPDCFNSGVFVFRPSLDTHQRLLQHAADFGSFDGSDQGVLNSFFSAWATDDIRTHLPFTYNLSAGPAYSYGPAFRQFGSAAKVVRFSGPAKPWSCRLNPQPGAVLGDGPGPACPHQCSFLGAWWWLFQRRVLPLYGHTRGRLDGPPGPPHRPPSDSTDLWGADLTPSTGQPCEDAAVGSSQPWPAQGRVGAQTVDEDKEEEEEEEKQEEEEETPPPPGQSRSEDVLLALSISEMSIQAPAAPASPGAERRKWEQGLVDYMGRDAFARIQEKLDRFLQ